MLGQNIFLLAVMGLTGFSHAAVLRDADIAFRRDIQQLTAPLIGDHEVLNAFKALGYTPHEVLLDNYGDVMQNNYKFDEEEWENMRDHLHEQAGFNSSDLDPRAFEFICTGFNNHPLMYTATLSPIAAVICGTFHYVTAEKAVTYVGEKSKNADGTPLKDRVGTKVKAVLTYTWYITSAASGGECAGLIGYGINNFCVSQVNGNEGTKPGTAGMKDHEGNNRKGSIIVDKD